MYDLSVFLDENISIEWTDLFYGIKYGLLFPSVASQYADVLSEKRKLSDDEISFFLDSHGTKAVLDILEKILGQTLDSLEKAKFATLKICVAILIRLRKIESNPESLFEKINFLYSMLDYPEEMEGIVPYMPPNDGYKPSQHTKEENTKRLIDKIDEFITTNLAIFSSQG